MFQFFNCVQIDCGLVLLLILILIDCLVTCNHPSFLLISSMREREQKHQNNGECLGKEIIYKKKHFFILGTDKSLWVVSFSSASWTKLPLIQIVVHGQGWGYTDLCLINRYIFLVRVWMLISSCVNANGIGNSLSNKMVSFLFVLWLEIQVSIKHEL